MNKLNSWELSSLSYSSRSCATLYTHPKRHTSFARGVQQSIHRFPLTTFTEFSAGGFWYGREQGGTDAYVVFSLLFIFRIFLSPNNKSQKETVHHSRALDVLRHLIFVRESRFEYPHTLYGIHQSDGDVIMIRSVLLPQSSFFFKRLPSIICSNSLCGWMNASFDVA